MEEKNLMEIPFESLVDLKSVVDPEQTMVKFNMNDGDRTKPALDYLLDDEDESKSDWKRINAHRKKGRGSSNDLDKAEYLLAFAQYYPLGPQYYLFGGLYRITEKKLHVQDGTGYELKLLDVFREYRKRLIIKLEKPIGQHYSRWYSNFLENMKPTVYELTPDPSMGNFPGYNNVLLKHQKLRSIWEGEAPEWQKALSNVKAVYCITDRETGRLYIGSAYGKDNGLWQRWSRYADPADMTGGNKTFEEIKQKDPEYIRKNFTYAILEIFDTRTKDEYIIHREEFWKKVFQSVEKGMNN